MSLERFLRRVRKTNKCWWWMGYRDKDGYGRPYFKGKRIGAHRLAYILFIGPVRDGEDVCHSCDNPPCVRPSHLWRGDNKGNTADRHAKKRDAAGAMNGRAVLSKRQVDALRRRRLHGASYGDLVRRFNISKSQVARIVKGTQWD